MRSLDGRALRLALLVLEAQELGSQLRKLEDLGTFFELSENKKLFLKLEWNLHAAATIDRREKVNMLVCLCFFAIYFLVLFHFLEATENDTDALLKLCLYSSPIGGRIADSASPRAAGGGKISGEVRVVRWKERKRTREDYLQASCNEKRRGSLRSWW